MAQWLSPSSSGKQGQQVLGAMLARLVGPRQAQVSARIVAQVSALDGLHCYGVEFVEAAGTEKFWGIVFPKASS